MSGKKAVDKVSKGLTSLIDEFSSAVKEMVNAGEETVVHLAVGSSRVIKAAVDATGEVTKITVETASNVVSSVTAAWRRRSARRPGMWRTKQQGGRRMIQNTLGMMIGRVGISALVAGVAVSTYKHYYEKYQGGQNLRT